MYTSRCVLVQILTSNIILTHVDKINVIEFKALTSYNHIPHYILFGELDTENNTKFLLC